MSFISKAKVTETSLFIIADVHANSAALSAVLALKAPDEKLVCAGDIVGYYPDVNEVCEQLRGLSPVVIRGNHDAYLLGALTPKPENRRKYMLDWTAEHISSENRLWLSELPTTVRIDAFANGAPNCKEIVVRHANPFSEEGYIYPDTPLEDAGLEGGVTMILGHTHHPMERQFGAGRLVNPGSVGQPRDRVQGAAFCRLDRRTGIVTFERAAYDVRSYQAYLRSRDWPEVVTEMLTRSA